MSFLSGGSECASNANPLAQFSKSSQLDTSLQQSIRQQQQSQSNPLVGHSGQLRGTQMMNQQDQIQFNNFHKQQQQQPEPSNFNFQPMANEINMMRHEQIRQSPNSITNVAPQKMGAWSSEFSNSSLSVDSGAGAVASVDQQQSSSNAQFQQPQMNYRGPHMMGNMGGMGMNMGMSMMSRPSMLRNTQQQGNITDQQQKEEIMLSTEDWEESFKQIEGEEQQLDENEIVVDSKESAFDQVWDDIQQNYEETNNIDEFKAQWEKDFEKYATTRLNYGEYKFESENQFSKNPSAYEIGVKLMESGAKLSEAALAFEAALQEDPNHIDAWLKLGQVQTQNEKELAGISALEKCLELSPSNLTALMCLAISYVNEGYDNAAYATLERWIETKYPPILEKARLSNSATNEHDDRYTLNKKVTELFIKAAQLSPDIANMDADVQTGLGVLFYSMEEYDKTLDCFQSAINCNPNDALSWNRLGASLANSNKPEQAIEAYSKALQLNPNFVRARYNLGVSFINMGMYKDAVEQLLTGLSMHEVEGMNGRSSSGVVVDGNQSMSLLETLKRAFLAMDRRDLLDKVKPGMNVSTFRKMYGF